MLFAKIIAMITVLFMLGHSQIGAAGEILLNPPTGVSRPSSTDSREKARAYLKDEGSEPSVPNIVIIPQQDEGGIFSPRIIEMPQDNRSKAREYIRDKDATPGGIPVIVVPSSGSRTDSTRDAAERLRNKARGYSDGWDGATGSKPGTYVQIGTSTGVTGKDGVIVFDCAAIGNVVGRIGDDLRPGSEFMVVINGKNHKARCR